MKHANARISACRCSYFSLTGYRLADRCLGARFQGALSNPRCENRDAIVVPPELVEHPALKNCKQHPINLLQWSPVRPLGG
jgi:hypothetical protein